MNVSGMGGRKELGGVDERETFIKIYFMRKNIFNKKKAIFLIALIGMRNLLQWRGINVIDKEMKA